jgi:probable HAF family extracellular repeat protein
MDRDRSSWKAALVLAAKVLGASAAFPQSATFQGLGDLPGGAVQGFAIGVSADGQAVAGHSQSASGDEAFLWTAAAGLLGLGDLPAGMFNSFATMASNGGAIAVGYGSVRGGNRPFRWTGATGMVVLGDLPGGGSNGFATGMSGDGSVICGQSTSFSGTEAFRWTAASGMVGLGDLPGGGFNSSAWGVSGDGIAVFGDGTNSANHEEAFVWTEANGMVALGFLPGGGNFSGAHGASDGGRFVVGASDSLQSGPQGAEAFRWSAAGGMVGLGDLPGGAFTSFANGVSADGQVVVGGSEATGGTRAILWTAPTGMIDLKDLLLARGAGEVADWTLLEAHGISSDGATIIGYGVNPEGFTEPWIAHVPRFRDLRLEIRAGDRESNAGCGRDSNFILLGSPAAVPVTLFGAADFDVQDIIVSSVRLEGAEPLTEQIADKDGDGYLDLLATFRQSSLRITPESTTVTLTGLLTTSQAFEATATIRVSTSPPSRRESCSGR